MNVLRPDEQPTERNEIRKKKLQKRMRAQTENWNEFRQAWAATTHKFIHISRAYSLSLCSALAGRSRCTSCYFGTSSWNLFILRWFCISTFSYSVMGFKCTNTRTDRIVPPSIFIYRCRLMKWPDENTQRKTSIFTRTYCLLYMLNVRFGFSVALCFLSAIIMWTWPFGSRTNAIMHDNKMESKRTAKYSI